MVVKRQLHRPWYTIFVGVGAWSYRQYTKFCSKRCGIGLTVDTGKKGFKAYLILLSQHLPVNKSGNCSVMSYLTTEKTHPVVQLVRATGSTCEDDGYVCGPPPHSYLLLYKAQCLSPLVGSCKFWHLNRHDCIYNICYRVFLICTNYVLHILIWDYSVYMIEVMWILWCFNISK